MKQDEVSNKEKLFFLALVTLMSLYVLYEHFSSNLAVDQSIVLARHHNMLNGNSEFYNPWQYRILYIFPLEGFKLILNSFLGNTSNPIYPFLLLKFIQLFLIYYLSNYYFKLLGVNSAYLRYLGLLLICYGMSNSVFQADYAFNTYFDVIFYLLAAIVILSGRFWFLLVVAFFAALNRETSAFIPLMLLVLVKEVDISRNKNFLISGLSLAVFVLVFIGLRLYFGYKPAVGIHEMTSPWAYLKFNLTFFRMYPQWFGTFSILPILTLIGFNKLPKVLKYWIVLIVPLWFLIHLVKSTAVESRLFLVPTILLFVPSTLLLVTTDFITGKRYVTDK